MSPLQRQLYESFTDYITSSVQRRVQFEDVFPSCKHYSDQEKTAIKLDQIILWDSINNVNTPIDETTFPTYNISFEEGERFSQSAIKHINKLFNTHALPYLAIRNSTTQAKLEEIGIYTTEKAFKEHILTAQPAELKKYKQKLRA